MVCEAGLQTKNCIRSLRAAKLLLCVRVNDADVETVVSAVRAAVRGGLRAVEVTLTTPNALKIMDQLRSDGNVLVGAGTVTKAREAAAARNAGASFVMSPVTDPGLIGHCNKHDMLMIPGAMTPTEIHTAYNLAGAKVVKIFPANCCGSADFVSAMAGPFPHIPLLPTSGIELESVPGLLKAKNVLAVGISKQVLSSDIWRRKDWDALSARMAVWMKVADAATEEANVVKSAEALGP